jgi:hypothetical protein
LEYSLHPFEEYLNLTQSVLIYVGLGAWRMLLLSPPEYHSAYSSEHFWSPGRC